MFVTDENDFLLNKNQSNHLKSINEAKRALNLENFVSFKKRKLLLPMRRENTQSKNPIIVSIAKSSTSPETVSFFKKQCAKFNCDCIVVNTNDSICKTLIKIRKKHMTKPLVYVAIDGILTKKPSLFFDNEYDFMCLNAYNLPHRLQNMITLTKKMSSSRSRRRTVVEGNATKKCYDPRILQTIDTDVLYFGTHNVANRFLEKWNKYCSSYTEQQALDLVFNKYNFILHMRNLWLPHTYNLKTNMKGKQGENPVLFFNKQYSPRSGNKYIDKTLTVRKQCSVAPPLNSAGNIDWWFHEQGTKRANNTKQAQSMLRNAKNQEKRANLELKLVSQEQNNIYNNEQNKYKKALKKRTGLSRLGKQIRKYSEQELNRAKTRNSMKYVANYKQLLPKLASNMSKEHKQLLKKLSTIVEESQRNFSNSPPSRISKPLKKVSRTKSGTKKAKTVQSRTKTKTRRQSI